VKNPTLLGTVLLAHLLLVLPLLVWNSARQLRAARAAAPGPESALPVPRTQAMVVHAVFDVVAGVLAIRGL
jgi:hypothetical protein